MHPELGVSLNAAVLMKRFVEVSILTVLLECSLMFSRYQFKISVFQHRVCCLCFMQESLKQYVTNEKHLLDSLCDIMKKDDIAQHYGLEIE